MTKYAPEKNRQYTNEWRDRRRQKAISSLGGRCSKCGSTDQLEFDHVDPATKTLNIGRMWTASKARFYAELEKCQLLCKVCHVAKSQAEGSLKTAIKGVRYIRGSKAHTDGRTAL